MKIHCILNLYNDRMFLGAMLESIKDHVDSLIVADGAYELYFKKRLEYEGTELGCSVKPWSTDGSLEIIEDFVGLPPVKFIGCPDGKPWINQCVKRTALLDAVPDGDWLLHLDADEMLKGDVKGGLQEIYDSGCAVARVPLYNVGLQLHSYRPFWHGRIYEKLLGMHYYGTHWYLRDRHKRVVETCYPLKWTDKFVIVHFKALKELSHLIPHQDYMLDMKRWGWFEPKQDVMI